MLALHCLELFVLQPFLFYFINITQCCMLICFFFCKRESKINNTHLFPTINYSWFFYFFPHLYYIFYCLFCVLIGVYSLSSSAHNNINLTISFLYIFLNAWIMPWSSGWITDVQLGGKKWALTLVKESKNSTEKLWPPTLSINNKTRNFRQSFCNVGYYSYRSAYVVFRTSTSLF